MRRAYIIHGWEGYPEEGWFPWLKQELEKKGYSAEVPAMPHPEKPTIDDWTGKLDKIVGRPDEDTYLIGHSIGCQTILRYMQGLEKDRKIGGVVLVAGFVHLKPEEIGDEEDKKTARPWLETPMYWDRIKTHCDNYLAIFSQDDPCVPVEDAAIFAKELGAKTVILNGLQHINGEAGVTELPEALEFFK